MKRLLALVLFAIAAACGSPDSKLIVEPIQPPAEAPLSESRPPRVVIYGGYGVWAADILDTKYHVEQMGIAVDVVTSLSGVDYEKYAALIMPGGNAVKIGSGIGATQRDRLKQAILGGLNYLGHCAGGFFVGSWSSYYLKLIPQKLDYPSFYYSGETLSINRNTMMDGSLRHILYYGGPDLTPVAGKPLARYSNGQVSMVEFMAGKGLVIVTGGHPEASQITVNALGLTDPDGYDDAVERPLIRAIVNGKAL